ncbi:toll-like receptor 2 [Pomacea canaliculata]|uniref:toll-like receptor 2 n=1 Tax=Pomacea canaliculata TaxID=400727 RepID=UPI000D73A6D0|nr:toll-like receptor 2 [Pomacea canaliculata]
MSVGAANYVIMVLCLVVGTLEVPLSPQHERQAGHRLATPVKCERGQSSLWTPCGDDLCCCLEPLADCSGQNLSYIPAFFEFSNISHLDFSYNSLQAIDKKTLENVTSFTNIALEKNSLAYVHPNSFQNFTALRALNLDLNHLNDSAGLFLALKVTTSLENLTVNGNKLDSLDFSHVAQLRNLRFLHIRNNTIGNVETKDVEVQDNLVHLGLSKNVLSMFPEFCADNNTPIFPNLRYLNLEWNKITSLDDMGCLPNLSTLILSGNAIYNTKTNFLQGLPSLRTLFYKTCTSRFVEGSAFNHSGLQHLDVSENLWFFDHIYGKGINLDVFHFMPNLQTINISWTVFQFANESEMHRVLSPLTHVKEFIMRGTGIESIPRIVMRHFTNLTYLDVSDSEIPYLADNTFENLTNLRNLTLSYNLMTTFSERLLDPLLKGNQVITFDFSGNPFSCLCDLLWMIKNFQDQKAGSNFVFLNRDSYICTNPPTMVGVRLEDVSLSEQACIFNYNTYIAILLVSIFTVVITLLCALVYRFRWQCRFLVYTLQHRWSDRQGRTGVQTASIYDIFVSYDNRDNQWVHQVLQKELENNRRFRLCLHDRDFLPGKFISHNIIERLEESRAILLVLSNSFLKSEWCRFEMFLGVKSGLAEKRLVVVPVLLEDLDKTLVDSFVCTLLHTTTYIAWPARGTSTEIESFWKNLSLVISRRRRIQ